MTVATSHRHVDLRVGALDRIRRRARVRRIRSLRRIARHRRG
jgi:hypothetical protein